MWEYRGFEIQARSIDGEICFISFHGNEPMWRTENLITQVYRIDKYYDSGEFLRQAVTVEVD